jgi:hypothetical protein|tara:strand:+ start:287 stop:613 length:327 start_codon:yes stop_codon:yes gene_type:complete
MAQDFTRYIARAVGTSPVVTVFTANSNDTVISLRVANILGTVVTADVYVTVSSADYYLVKSLQIPAGSSVELIDGASRFVLASGDELKVVSNTSSAIDVWVSVVDAIS